MTFFNKKIWIAIFCLISAFIIGQLFVPERAHAAGVGSLSCKVTANMSQAVPVWDANAQAVKNVKCVSNGIAWQLARMALHALTASVVNWINSGFNGSPSFLSNPQDFFLDLADQATGAFISAMGPLKELCSPFNLDIRLSLALGQTQPMQRYTCTLSKIIKTQKDNLQRLQDGRLVTVTVDQNANGATIGDFQSGNILNNSNAVSINGASIDGFVEGDFYQGGLPAFWAMTTEPQNNPYGASLQAQSDLDMKVLAKQNATDKDLNRGAGFLSWQDCDNVQTPEGQQKNCRTETPGSVISSQLNKQLGAPTDELNLTSEINQVVSALFSQLVIKVLNSGLLSSSEIDVKSGSTQSVMDQLGNDPDLHNNFISLKKNTVSEMNQIISPVRQAVASREQALANMTVVSTRYEAARACLARRLDAQQNPSLASSIQDTLSSLDAAISANVTPRVAHYRDISNAANFILAELEDMKVDFQRTTTLQQLNNLREQYSDEIDEMSDTATDLQAAKNDLAASIQEAKDLQDALVRYETACSSAASGPTI